MPAKTSRMLFLISLGAVLEYYDFAIFIYLAPTIGKALIPVQNSMSNLILSFAIFALGTFSRPVGGMMFAHLGDTRGRHDTFIYTILFMAIPTFLIACIPNASIIGVWATLLLIVLRVIQGLAIGGEIPGSIVFGYEIAKKSNKALTSSIIILGTNIGFVLASLVCLGLTSLQLSTFNSWRLAFALGGVIGIISYGLRKKLSETPAFREYQQHLRQETVPIKLLLAQHGKAIAQLLGIACFLASSVAIFTFYMPIYLSSFYHYPFPKIMEFNSYTIIIFIIGSLLAGRFDQWLGKKFFISFTVTFGVAVLLLFPLYPHLNLTQILLIHLILLFAIGIICGRLPVLCATFFPVAVRYSGVALVYNISFGIIAGTTQMILTWLIKTTGLLWAPGLYLFGFSIVALMSVLSVPGWRLVDYQA